jgi:hypothetical protein
MIYQYKPELHKVIQIEDSLWQATGNLNARKYFYHIRPLDPVVAK